MVVRISNRLVYRFISLYNNYHVLLEVYEAEMDFCCTFINKAVHGDNNGIWNGKGLSQ